MTEDEEKKDKELCEAIIEKAKECAELLKDRDIRFVGTIKESRGKAVKL